MVTYRLVRELSANPNIATAMVQALKTTKLDIPMDNSEAKRCGIDFMKIEIPKNAKIKKVRRKRKKEKGNGKRSTELTKKLAGNRKEINKSKEDQNASQDILDLGTLFGKQEKSSESLVNLRGLGKWLFGAKTRLLAVP